MLKNMGDQFALTLLTNDTDLARRADKAGIDRVGLDLETLNKAERQAGRNCWISNHQFSDLLGIKQSLQKASVFIRTNPPHDGLKEEIEQYLAAGVRVLMLPMFYSAREAERFARIVDGRATTVLLVETPAAAFRLHDITQVAGIDEIHFGLNDLRLALGLQHHFEVLSSDLIDRMAEVVHAANLPLGIGGIGRVAQPGLAIPSDLVFAQLVRLGASRALVSRVLFANDGQPLDLSVEVTRIRQRLHELSQQPAVNLLQSREDLRHQISLLSSRA